MKKYYLHISYQRVHNNNIMTGDGLISVETINLKQIRQQLKEVFEKEYGEHLDSAPTIVSMSVLPEELFYILKGKEEGK